ncbi:hypothetical protein AAG570_004168 [Ranatra chinensis]|uniref:Uncharacterized protein n=1 Tax=Ranatra chinensis TaxID=642074 RepID=A0ABD0YHI7_9HEMI
MENQYQPKRFADNKSDEEMVFSYPMVSAQEQVGKLHQMDTEYERTLKKRSDPDEGALAEERDDGRSMYVLVPLDQLRKRDLNFTPPMEFDIDLKPMKSRTETLVDNRNEYVPSRTACHVVEPGAAPPMKPVSLKMTITNLLPPAEARGSKPLLMKNSSTVDSRGTLTVALDIKQCESSVQTPTMDETETGRERPCPPKLTEYPETLVENQGPAHLRKVQPEGGCLTLDNGLQPHFFGGLESIPLVNLPHYLALTPLLWTLSRKLTLRAPDTFSPPSEF